MADNVTIPASGTGTATPVIATDDVSGVHYQKVKLDLGADGASTAVSGSVPISDGGNVITVDGTVGVSGSVDTELPAAAAISAENTAAPTAPAVYGFGLVFDGTNWDRQPGTSVDGTLVNLGTNNDVTVTSGSITADTELPAVQTHADNLAVSNAPAVIGANYVYDGSNWDRQRGDSTDGTLVNLGTNNDVTVTSGSITADTELATAAALADGAANPNTATVGSAGLLFNGTTWERARAGNADAMSTGVVAAGMMVLNSSTWDRLKGAASGDATTAGGLAGGVSYLYNGVSAYDRTRGASAFSAAPNVDTGILAAGVGPGYDRKRDPSNLGTAANSAITNTVDGADVFLYYIGTATSGTYTLEVTADDTNWVAAKWVNATTGAISSGNLTPAVGDVWMVFVSGWRQVRIRTVTTLGVTVAVKTTAHLGFDTPSTWRSLTNARAMDVSIVDATGAQITSFGGGTQYAGDAAATSTPTGTMAMGLANAAAPADVSANNDAVAAWMLRNGSQVVNIAAGGTLLTNTGQAAASANFNKLTDGTLTVGAVDETGASAVDALAVGGATPHDSVDSGNPVKIGGKSSNSATPTAVTDGDRVNMLFDQSGRASVAVGAVTGGSMGDGNANNNYLSVTPHNQAPAMYPIPTFPLVFNGSTWDRERGNTSGTFAQGPVAQDLAVGGNPVAIGLRASTAVPTAMSGDGDAVFGWANRSGAAVVTNAPHVGLNSDPWNLVHEAAQYTSTQTSTVLVAGGASEKLVVTKVQIQAFATTAFDLQLYFGTGAFARGTNRACFDGTFKPSSTLAPGVVMDGPFISGTNGDDLMVTTSAAGSVTINVWYYVVT